MTTATAPARARTTFIQPTVGRVVHFFKHNPNARPQHQGPLAAHVAKVLSDTRVNLMVIGENGIPFSETGVQLVQQGEEVPEANYCCWMEWQLGQAQRTEAAERQLAGAGAGVGAAGSCCGAGNGS